jgi:hypothetical protein
VLTVDAMDAEARHLSAKAHCTLPGGVGKGTAIHYDDHDGNYSIHAAHAVLKKHRLRLWRWRKGRARTWETVVEEKTGQFIVCIDYAARDVTTGAPMTHVIGIDCDRCLLLDSQGLRPLALTLENLRRKTRPTKEYPGTHITQVYRITAF